MKISNFFGKKITDERGTPKGYVIGVLKREDKIVCLKCASEGESIFYADFSKVNFSIDAVTYCNKLTSCTGASAVKLGKICIDDNGKYLGILTDLECENGIITHAYINGKRRSFKGVKDGDVTVFAKKENPVKSVKPVNVFTDKHGIFKNFESAKTGDYVKSVLTKL